MLVISIMMHVLNCLHKKMAPDKALLAGAWDGETECSEFCKLALVQLESDLCSRVWSLVQF